MSETKSRLFTLLRERCYQEGDFTLSSGEKSPYYFDIKMLELHSEGVSLMGQVIYDLTKDLDIDAIGGLEIGAIPLTTAAVYIYGQNGREMEGFIVRREAKKHGTKKIIEGVLRPGSKVLIVDDVITKGGSVLTAVAAARKAECEPILILSMVDRLGGAAELFAKEGIEYQSVFSIRDFTHAPTTSR